MNHTPQCDTCMAGFHACEVCKDGSSYEKAPVPNGPAPYAQPITGFGPGPMNDKALAALGEASLHLTAEVGRTCELRPPRPVLPREEVDETERRLNELNDAQRLGQQRSDERRCEAVLFGSATIDEPRDIRCDLAEGHDGRHAGTSTRRVSWG